MPTSDLSVIVPFVNDWSDLSGCLAALGRDQDAGLEIIVVDRTGDVRLQSPPDGLPPVVLIPVARDATIPEMRAVAIRRASAPAIAVIEDHVIVPEGWARRMLDALGEDQHVVAGAVENAATGTLTDWAAFLCEYSAALPPLPSGPVAGLTGNNTIYRAETLRRFDRVLDEGAWENRLHDAMRADGIVLIQRPDIVVGHKMHYSFGLYMSQRFLYSRSYAGARARAVSLPKRMIMGAAALVALPPLQFWRTVSRIRAKGRHRDELRRSLPLLVPFVLSWGAGEAAGYWLGAGKSLSKVR